MFPPIPAPFAGSMPGDCPPPALRDRVVERSFAALAVGGAATVGLGGLLMAEPAHWPLVLGLACAALLAPALTGIWLRGRMADQPGITVARLYELVIQRIEGPQERAVRGPAQEDAQNRFAGVFSEIILRSRTLSASLLRTRAAVDAGNTALRAGRDQAHSCATRLQADSAAMADTAADIMNASARMQQEVAAARSGAAGTGAAVAQLSERAMGLAGSVRAVTGQVRQMTQIAVNSADAAFGAQATLARLAEQAAALGRTTDQVNRALQMAGACGRQASAQAGSGASVAQDLSANLAEMALCAEQALDGMAGVIAGLRDEAGAANRRIAELCALLTSQHALGDALSHAVGQQGEEIAEVLAGVMAAYDGCDAVRGHVEAIGHGIDARLASAEALRGAAGQVPAHAETIARILRSIPDFAPPLEF